jgi:hypothetical protein
VTPILRCLVIAGTLCVALGTGGAANACTTLGLGCSAVTTGATGDLADDGGGMLDGTRDGANGAVTGVVDGVGDTATGAIDDVTGAAPPVPGVEPPGILPLPSGDDPPGAPRDGDVRDRGRDDRRAAVMRRDSPPPAPVVRRPAAEAPVITSISSAASEAPRHGSERFGDAIAAALPSFVALVALFGLVLGFVAIQAWVDGRDPRLAAAPSVDEMVWFR